jgi:S1-C subfamily serine protease
VLVLVRGADGNVASGSGFFVAPGIVLTNRHVVEGGRDRRIVVVNRTIGVKAAEVQAETPLGPPGSPDFAQLRVPESDKVVPLSFGPPAEAMANVVAAGFPGMVLRSDDRFRKLIAGEASDPPDITVTTGIVGQVQQIGGATTLLHQAQVTPGNSGGPLVDGCGRVMGVNTFIQAAREGRWDYALGAADAARFLASNGVSVRNEVSACNATSSSAPTSASNAGGAANSAKRD